MSKKKEGFSKYLEYQYRQTGSFYTQLFKAIQVADPENRARLVAGFPEEVEAYLTWSRKGAQDFLEHIPKDHRLREKFIREYALEDKE